MYNLHVFLILLFCLSSQHATAKIYKWVDESGKTQFTDTPPPNYANLEEAPVTQKGVKHNSLHNQSLLLRVRSLFKQKKFKKLNDTLSKYQSDSEHDIAKEQQLLTAYFAFEEANESIEPLFTEWTKETPNQYQPYLARARYYYRLAWEARGSAWSSETSRKQMKKMANYFNKASEDIASALTISDKTILPYSMLIGISMNIGDHEKTKIITQQALSISPASFIIRATYMDSLLPRWGGSYKAMQQFATESQKHASKNPKLKWLLGSVYLDAANRERRAKNYESAQELYSKALEFGDYHYVIFEQGKCYYWQKDYTKAFQNIEEALKLYSDNYEYHYWRSKILAQQEKYAKAATSIQYAKRLNPNKSSVHEYKDWLVSKLINKAYQFGKEGNTSKQLKYCDIAIQLDPNNADAYSRRARAYTHKNMYDLALQDVKVAIQLEPHNISSYQLIDYILVFKQDWNTIIKYWTQYIKLHPNDGLAYVERGGTHYRKGDRQAAVADAKTSADLGNARGKVAYERFR